MVGSRPALYYIVLQPASLGRWELLVWIHGLHILWIPTWKSGTTTTRTVRVEMPHCVDAARQIHWLGLCRSTLRYTSLYVCLSLLCVHDIPHGGRNACVFEYTADNGAFRCPVAPRSCVGVCP